MKIKKEKKDPVGGILSASSVLMLVHCVVIFQKTSGDQQGDSQTICWHHRWMIPPLGQEHSHGKTQYIPGKQVLVSVRLWKTNKKTIVLEYSAYFLLEIMKLHNTFQITNLCTNKAYCNYRDFILEGMTNLSKPTSRRF